MINSTSRSSILASVLNLLKVKCSQTFAAPRITSPHKSSSGRVTMGKRLMCGLWGCWCTNWQWARFPSRDWTRKTFSIRFLNVNTVSLTKSQNNLWAWSAKCCNWTGKKDPPFKKSFKISGCIWLEHRI